VTPTAGRNARTSMFKHCTRRPLIFVAAVIGGVCRDIVTSWSNVLVRGVGSSSDISGSVVAATERREYISSSVASSKEVESDVPEA